MSSIPILNLYYLLSYSWDRLDLAEQRKIGASDFSQPIDLLARVFLNALGSVFKKGLEREYRQMDIEYAGIKGKLDLETSLKRSLFAKGLAQCSFDELSEDILSNQLLKAVLKRLVLVSYLNPVLRREVKSYLRYFAGVRDIRADKKIFSRVRLHRNSGYYRFPLELGRLILAQTAIDELEGLYVFRDFDRDHWQMARLFESFVRNFYFREQAVFKVFREDIDWQIDEDLSTGNLDLIPKMQTDISLSAATRKIVIDAKFYASVLFEHYDVEKLRSTHLYQLYCYLDSLAQESGDLSGGVVSEGILLYPENGRLLDESYRMGRHQIRICTIDLDMPWQQIHERLLGLIA